MLASQLARHFHTLWVPEYARTYLENLDRPYKYEDILGIAKGQVAQIEKVSKKAGSYLFSDTEMTVTKIWCEFKYGKCHPWILEQLEKQDFDLYLLMDTDLPWEFDPQREHPGKRKELFDLYLKELLQRKVKFEIISGIGEKRFQKALEIINSKF